MDHRCKRFHLLAIAAALIPGTAMAATFTGKNGYQVTVPAGWKTNTSGLLGTDAVFYQPAVNGFATNINLITVSAAPGETATNESKKTYSLLRQVLTSYHQISSKPTRIDHHGAVEVQGNYVQGVCRRLYMHQFTILSTKSDFTFTLSCPPGEKAKYDPAFMAMVRSTHVTAG